ncbi:hypothetical protein AB0F64_38925 [Streptomyces sp. NPDC026294]|uniref:hypothetical protein n=1 Tax=Streptomyces sp. NPDC026294 TaxID=3155362 RepID=UPI003406C990
MVSSASDAAVLAADACAEAGLTVPELPGPLIADPLAVLPPGARAVNPVDTTATVPGTRHGAVDAVLVTLIPTALSAATGDDPARALVPPSGTRPRPIATVLLDQDVPLQLLQGGAAAVPAYADPTSATRALAHAVSSAHRHAEPLGTAPALEDIDSEAAAALVADFLAHNPEGGWAGPQLCGALLDAYGTPQSPWEWATDADAAVAAAERRGGRPDGTESALARPAAQDRRGDAAPGPGGATAHPCRVCRARPEFRRRDDGPA